VLAVTWGEDLEARVLDACVRLGWPSGLRPAQREALSSVFLGKDTLVVIKTSAGKSALFQVPALAGMGPVLVISPLIALMSDQVSKLRSRGVEARSLTSFDSSAEKRVTRDLLLAGKVDLLYVSPERLEGMSTEDWGERPPGLIALDEAHCISEWGHDFRPSYRKIGKNLGRMFRRWGKRIPLLAVTATATTSVVEDIQEVLDFGSDAVYRRWSSDRPNISYRVAGSHASIPQILQRTGGPALVYGSTRAGVEQMSTELARAGFRCRPYHAALPRDTRRDVQAAFVGGDLEVCCATCAFGMGVDHSGIRAVIHLEMPATLESFVQEAGRAGRDGQPCFSVVRATTDALQVSEAMISQTWPAPSRVRSFYHELLKLARRLDRGGQVQLTNTEIADRIVTAGGRTDRFASRKFSAQEVGSCLRLLYEHGVIHRVPYQERTVALTLQQIRRDRRLGDRQRATLERLASYADPKGRVEGSVAFFSEIGIDKAYAMDLSNSQLVYVEWVEASQLISVDLSRSAVELDDPRIVAIADRARSRVSSARGYLYTDACRRQYLLDYFGDTQDEAPTSACCDLCANRAKGL
jgi:RecQ family ATP-dependent DNA helicase